MFKHKRKSDTRNEATHCAEPKLRPLRFKISTWEICYRFALGSLAFCPFSLEYYLRFRIFPQSTMVFSVFERIHRLHTQYGHAFGPWPIVMQMMVLCKPLLRYWFSCMQMLRYHLGLVLLGNGPTSHSGVQKQTHNFQIYLPITYFHFSAVKTQSCPSFVFLSSHGMV